MRIEILDDAKDDLVDGPRAPHPLLVPKTIEDLAGNNIGKAFEVDLFEGVERRFTNATVRLPFEVR